MLGAPYTGITPDPGSMTPKAGNIYPNFGGLFMWYPGPYRIHFMVSWSWSGSESKTLCMCLNLLIGEMIKKQRCQIWSQTFRFFQSSPLTTKHKRGRGHIPAPSTHKLPPYLGYPGDYINYFPGGRWVSVSPKALIEGSRSPTKAHVTGVKLLSSRREGPTSPPPTSPMTSSSLYPRIKGRKLFWS